MIDRSGQRWTGEDFGDLAGYLRVITAEGYPADRILQSLCSCGATTHRLDADPVESIAQRSSSCRLEAWLSLMTRERIKGLVPGATAAVLGRALRSAFGSGVVSEPWAVYSGRVALVVFGGWRAVWLLPRRPLIEALIEMAEQLALYRALRHGVVAAA